MKTKILISVIGVFALLSIFSVIVMAADNVLLDSVDFGSAGNDDEYKLVGWGRSATDQTGGNYGGIGPGGCRLVWDGESDYPYAEFSLFPSGGSAETLVMQHLDGMTDDSFDLDVKDNEDWILAGHYSDQTSSETWVTSTFDLNSLEFDHEGEIVFRITATGDKWLEFENWGQLCIDRAEIYGTYEPGEGQFCNEHWKPPINLPKHTVNVRATLPLKFWLADCEGNPPPAEAEPQLVVHFLGNEEDEGGDTYEPTLKRGTGGYQFIALFRPEKHGSYKAIVTYAGGKWVQEFVVVEQGNGNDKHNFGDKQTGNDKYKPGKPESAAQNGKGKDKPRGKPPGKGRGPKKP